MTKLHVAAFGILTFSAACAFGYAENGSKQPEESSSPGKISEAQSKTAAATAAKQSALPAAREMTLNLADKVTMKLLLIPPGKFLMGTRKDDKGRVRDEGIQHEVTLSRPFYIGIYEVTQEQYEAVIGKNKSHFKGASRPADGVSWFEAVEFCKAASRKTGKTVRLPTEAEWEYACRAGTSTRFSFGDDEGELYKYGNYCERSNKDKLLRKDTAHDDGFDKTAPVGSFKPNPWGLYDMHGNVWEWCSDWYQATDYSAGAPAGQWANSVDPTGPALTTHRVLRGGCWRTEGGACHSAHRNSNPPGHHHGLIGFRAVVSAEATAEKQ